MRIRMWVWGLVAAISFAWGGCSSREQEQVYEVRGVVVAPVEDGQIVINHEAIPDFMPAMTMPFYVDAAESPEVSRLQPGDEVSFKFRVGESSRAFDFRVLRAAPAKVGRAAGGSAGSRRVREGEVVRDFELVDQAGQKFDRNDLRGKLSVLTFIFTRCPVPEFCPRIMAEFQKLHAALDAREEVQLLSVTIDPEHDTPEVLREYAARFGADAERWRFLTGSPAQVDDLRAAFAVFAERTAGTIDHTLATALIGPDGKLLKVWRGNEWTSDEVQAALAEHGGR